MKKIRILVLSELLLLFGFGALRVSLQLSSVWKILFSLCIVFLAAAVYIVAELRAAYVEKPTLYKSVSVISFCAANAFYCFAFCFDFPLHRYRLLYCTVTALILIPAALIDSADLPVVQYRRGLRRMGKK